MTCLYLIVPILSSTGQLKIMKTSLKNIFCFTLFSFLVASSPQLQAVEIKENPWEYVAIKLTFKDALSGVAIDCNYGKLTGRSGGEANVRFESDPSVVERIQLTEKQVMELHSTIAKFVSEYKLRDTSGLNSDTLKQTFVIVISIPETAIEMRLSYGEDQRFQTVKAIFGGLLKSFSPRWAEKMPGKKSDNP